MPAYNRKVVDLIEAESGGWILWLACGHESFTPRKKPPKTHTCKDCEKYGPVSKSTLIPKDQIPSDSCNKLLIEATRKLQDKYDKNVMISVGETIICNVIKIDGNNLELKITEKL